MIHVKERLEEIEKRLRLLNKRVIEIEDRFESLFSGERAEKDCKCRN